MVGIKHGTEPSSGDNATAAWAAEAHTIEGLCRAYCSTNQSINDTTWTKVQLDTESFDPDSLFDATTNYRYSPATAGYYLVAAAVNFQNLGDGNHAHSAIYKTGVLFSKITMNTGSNDATSLPIIDILYLGASDYIELYTYQDSGGAELLDGGEDTTWISITPLRV